MNTYSPKIQRAINDAIRQRGKLNDLYEQLEAEYEKGIEDVTADSAEHYLDLRAEEHKQRQKCKHLHMLIGQWLVDEMVGCEYGD